MRSTMWTLRGGWQWCTWRPSTVTGRSKMRSRPAEKKATRSSASTNVMSTGSVEKMPSSCSKVSVPVGKTIALPPGTVTVSRGAAGTGGR